MTAIPPVPPVPPVPRPAAALAAAAPHSTHRRGPRTWLVLNAVFGLLLLAALALVVVAVVGSETGVVGFLLGTALASFSLPVVVAAFLWVDRHEPEPPRLLLFAFAWGAVVAALASGALNTVGLMAVSGRIGEHAGLETTAVIVAPVVEEATKAIGVLVILLARRREFDGVVDGIVCAGLVGVGFAFTENVLYYGRAYLQADESAPGSGVLAAGVTFVLRGIISPFAHPLFTVMTGIGLGIAAGTRSAATRLLAPVAGYAGAVALHMAWNLSAVGGLRGFVAGYLGLMLPIFLTAVVVAVWVSSRERAAIIRTLPAYVHAGWLPAYDVAMIAIPRARRRARTWAGHTQGPAARRAMADYQDAAAELALLRDRAEKGQLVDGFVERERALLVDLDRARGGFLPVLR